MNDNRPLANSTGYIVNNFEHVGAGGGGQGLVQGLFSPMDTQTHMTENITFTAPLADGKINLTLLTHIRILDTLKHLKLAT